MISDAERRNRARPPDDPHRLPWLGWRLFPNWYAMWEEKWHRQDERARCWVGLASRLSAEITRLRALITDMDALAEHETTVTERND